MTKDRPADVVMIIRHAEKPDDPARWGLTDEGRPDEGALTIRGWTRAGALAELLAPRRGEPPAGLGRPTAIYAPSPKHAGKGLRSMQTVTPLADKLGLHVNHRHGTGEEAALAAEILGVRGVTLIAWEHSAIAEIVKGLGAIAPAPPSEWAGHRYDLVWVFTRTGPGWSFAQVPQLLLDGDSADPID